MRIPLQTRFGLLILPLIVIQLICLFAILLPGLQTSGDLRRLELHLRRHTVAARLTRLLDRQAQESVDFAMRREDADRLHLDDVRARARSVLAHWQALKRHEIELTPAELRLSDAIERDYRRLDELSDEISAPAAGGKPPEALSSIQQELVPLLGRIDGDLDRVIEAERTEFLKGLAYLAGRLAVADLATSGKFSRDLDATISDASRAFVADQFARALSRELFLYSLTVAVGRKDPAIETAQGRVQDALADWRRQVHARSDRDPAHARELTLLSAIEGGYARIAEAGGQLVSSVERGRPADAARLLAQELQPVAEGEIAPVVEQVVTTGAAEVEVALAALATRTRWVFAALGVVGLLGLAICLGTPMLIGRQIIRPVVELRRLAASLGAGDLNVRAKIGAHDELGELGMAFNKMASGLENRTREMRVLGSMGDLLQACMTPEEACEVLVQSSRELFPADSGVAFVFAPSRDVLEPAVTWGSSAHYSPFAPDECWALRRGRLQVIAAGSGGPRCSHVGEDGDYLCAPMAAQGEMLGVLHIHLGSSGAGDEGESIEDKQRLALSVADQFGLALTNLRLRETLRGLSIRDPLTGLFNRRYLEESLERELRRAQRRSLPVAVIMIDIDLFKRFNDTFGHEAGDQALKEVATLLLANIRAEDIACRYGGEELVLILPEMTFEVAQERAERLAAAVRHLRIPQPLQAFGTVTISAGVAVFPTHGSSGRAVINAADQALYRAKQLGRDRVEVA
jgi:diguanylate cyclase (GGDEF)-like protein